MQKFLPRTTWTFSNVAWITLTSSGRFEIVLEQKKFFFNFFKKSSQLAIKISLYYLFLWHGVRKASKRSGRFWTHYKETLISSLREWEGEPSQSPLQSCLKKRKFERSVIPSCLDMMLVREVVTFFVSFLKEGWWMGVVLDKGVI